MRRAHPRDVIAGFMMLDGLAVTALVWTHHHTLTVCCSVLLLLAAVVNAVMR